MNTKMAFSAITLVTLAACGGGGGSGDSSPNTSTTFSLNSTAFASGSSIPNAYRCVSNGGGGSLPLLSWTNLPTDTKSIVIIMDDVDASAVQGSTFTHYLALIPRQTQLSAIPSIDQVSNPTMPYEKIWSTSGSNWVVLSDSPPCNPQTTAHTYRWTIYAMNDEYTNINQLKIQLDSIINSATSSSNTLNLNYSPAPGLLEPRITRSSFENAYGSYIINKATLIGTM